MIDFPGNPTIGFTFAVGNTIYKCIAVNPAVWTATVATAGIPDAPVDANTYGRSAGAWAILTKSTVGLGNVDNTSDVNKPVSTATAAALAGKEPTIAASTSANYWRGDKTWQPLNAATVNAVAKTGDTMSGALTTTTVNTPAVKSLSDRLLLQSDTYVDHVNIANSVWVTARAGTFIAQGSGDAIQSPNGNISTNQMLFAGGPGVRTTGPCNADGRVTAGAAEMSAFYAPNGGANIGTVINAGGRISSNVGGDVAALYCSQSSSGIYTEGSGSASFRSTNGGMTITGAGSRGVTFSTYAPEGGYNNVYGLLGNPAWNNVQIQLSHQSGVWAGWRSLGGSNEIQFIMSNGGAWGSITAASFNVASDERGKAAVAPLPQQHASFMGIVPVSWKIEQTPLPPPVRPEVRNIDGTLIDWPTEPGVYYDDPERIHWGFSAQNLTSAVRSAVIGDVTAVDSDGKPIIASIDPVPIIALTVLEVQNLFGEIDALKARLTALGG